MGVVHLYFFVVKFYLIVWVFGVGVWTVTFNVYMDEVELSGVQFTSKANSIPKSEKRTKIKTNRNVILEWHGEMKDAGIEKTEVDAYSD